jgi:hypothetical protein
VLVPDDSGRLDTCEIQQRVPIGLDVESVCGKTYDKKLCSFYGLWRYLDTELLNTNLVHHVGKTKEVQWIVWQLHSSNFL